MLATTGIVSRWIIRTSGAEGGGDTGSDMGFVSRTDAGGLKDSDVLYLKRSDSHVGVNTITPDANFEVESTSTDGHQLVTLDQNDSDQAFIDFQGTSGAGTSYSINTSERSTFSAMIMIEINGTVRWLKAYS